MQSLWTMGTVNMKPGVLHMSE